MTDRMRESLVEYLMLSSRLTEIDEADADCHCADFYCCPNCQTRYDTINSLGTLIDAWGTKWADELAKREGMLTEVDA